MSLPRTITIVLCGFWFCSMASTYVDEVSLTGCASALLILGDANAFEHLLVYLSGFGEGFESSFREVVVAAGCVDEMKT